MRIYDLVGPDCGQVTIALDDRPPVTNARFDAYCTYHRLATLSVGEELPEAVHTVKLTIHPDPPDKVKILSERSERMDDALRHDAAGLDANSHETRHVAVGAIGFEIGADIRLTARDNSGTQQDSADKETRWRQFHRDHSES